MNPEFRTETMKFKTYNLDCRDVMDMYLADNSVDSIVTDPPYGLGFMGKEWDHGVPGTEFWERALRVLKPGGHLLAFSGSRTYHRMVCAIEDAGFEIRDQIMWVYGSGFPKSLDVSKAIDKAAGAEREVVGVAGKSGSACSCMAGDFAGGEYMTTAANTDAARQWQGWGTALKPAFEPLVFATKPLPVETERHTIDVNLFILEARLWSLSLANAAEKNSTSNQNELNAACAIAQWTVADCTSTQVALSGQMGMSQFELVIPTILNIVSSWRGTLADLLKHGSTCTTGTRSNTTTDWKTLSYCLSHITPHTIITGLLGLPGCNVSAWNAVQYFNAELKRLNATLELSALVPAISQDRQNYLDVDERVKHEPIVVARKPLIGTVATNVLMHGTGALNIDRCRVANNGEVTGGSGATKRDTNAFGDFAGNGGNTTPEAGRWPANLIHDGSAEVTAEFPQTTSGARKAAQGALYGAVDGGTPGIQPRVDSGSAARFFYCAKASKSDRDSGLGAFEQKRTGGMQATADGSMLTGSGNERVTTRANTHPTVKPTDLMAYLCRLVTPPGGIVLDPFMGSGSTGKAAVREGFRFIGCELETEYHLIADARLKAAL